MEVAEKPGADSRPFWPRLSLSGGNMSLPAHLGTPEDRLADAQATAPRPVPAFPDLGLHPETAARFPAIIDAIADAHRPSNSPFFQRLSELPRQIAADPRMLGELFLVYQAAMHATRAAVYFLPHLDNPAMRKRKLQIFVDDDGLPGGDTHHYQLTRAFQNIGALCPIDDEEFGEADELVSHLDAQTAKFVRLSKTLYSRSLGPWCIVETMSDDWMRALANSLAKHFPLIVKEPYFADCFSQGVEERHAEEAIAVTQAVLERRPELLAETIEDARTMAKALDGVWVAMDDIINSTITRHEQARPDLLKVSQ
jgi:pyrroloquinoline quinone (PQQ) biosynthesis protein C